jgi:predicted dehydrogenase
MAQNIVGGEMLAAMGHCRNDLRRAPIAVAVHDNREYPKRALTPLQAQEAAWAEVTSDWSYTAIVRLGDRAAEPGDRVTVIARCAGLDHGKNRDYVAVYGEQGTIHIEHVYAEGTMFLRTTSQDWEALIIPQRIIDSVPGPGLWPQRLWTRLALDFVADIRGEEAPPYLTFREGWIYQEVIEMIRTGRGWTAVPSEL